MKMKIPIVDPTNIYNNHESPNDYMASESNNSSQPEDANSRTADDDFSEYLWMENEEEFDKQILLQLEEEALMEHCIEVMLDHERDLDNVPYFSSLGADDTNPQTWSDGQQAQNGSDLSHQMSNLRVQDKDEIAKKSTLNPNAAEFVPQPRTPVSLGAEKTS